MKKLWIILALRALLLALVMGFSGIGLFPDEAQYWTWSQELDFGYYSKPPGIAWQIWLTTTLFGDTAFGVRMGALILGSLLPLAVYACAKASALKEKTCFWAALITAFSPLGVYLSFAATTDGGAILFFTFAAAVVAKGIQEEKGPRYLLAGLLICAGALFKWTAFIFWIVLLPQLFFFKNLRQKSLIFAIGFSLLALLPSLYWNQAHDWATWRHVSRAVGSGHGANFFEFLGAQIGLLFPLFFLFLVLGFVWLRKCQNPPLQFLAAFPLFALFYLVAACFKKIQPNWTFYLYPAGLSIAAWVALERLKWGRIWLQIGTGLSLATFVVIFAIPKLPVPYALNPFRHALGFERLETLLVEAGYCPANAFLFADKYQTASLLSFYGPEQKRAYFFNISHSRKNQFSYWPQMESGQDGYFVMVENTKESSLNWYEAHYHEKLSPYFKKTTLVSVSPLYSVAGQPVKYALIFKCSGYSGLSPPELSKY